MVAHAGNPISQEAEAGGYYVPGQLEPYSKTLSQKSQAEEQKKRGQGTKV